MYIYIYNAYVSTVMCICMCMWYMICTRIQMYTWYVSARDMYLHVYAYVICTYMHVYVSCHSCTSQLQNITHKQVVYDPFIPFNQVVYDPFLRIFHAQLGDNGWLLASKNDSLELGWSTNVPCTTGMVPMVPMVTVSKKMWPSGKIIEA
jgi:hypothetical protein